MEELQLEANGLRFRCLVEGPQTGPLVLLLHGFPEGGESWTGQLQALGEAGRFTIAPDLRGYGGTDCPGGESSYRIEQLVADVDGLLDVLGHDRCHLAGHDWGALVGWAYVACRPQRVLSWSALSVGHPGAFDPGDADQRQRSSYIDLFRMAGKAESVLSEDGFRRLRQLYRAGAATDDAISPAVVDSFVKGFERPGRLTAALSYYRANLGEDALADFPAVAGPITAPTQLIWGDRDPALGRGQAERTGAQVAGDYRLEVLEGAGHWLQFERPWEVSDLLLEWVASY
jgi:pimeloyl-ACP methyl ester carboxylesterase